MHFSQIDPPQVAQEIVNSENCANLRNECRAAMVERCQKAERALQLPGVLIWLSITLTPALSFSQDAARMIPLARQAVESEVNGKAAPRPTASSLVRAVFVTIERNGKILGCRGSLVPLESTLEQEVIHEARAAADHDPRYRPIQPADLANYLVTVTVVRDMQPIENVRDLTPSEGLVLKCGDKTGVVLPWEGKNPDIRLDWAYKKAGVSKGSAVTLYKLIAERERG